MEIKSIDSYRDGGTIHVVLFDDREFFVDHRLGTTSPNALFAAYPKNDATSLEDKDGLLATYFNEVLTARNKYHNGRSKLRSVSCATIEEVKLHKSQNLF